MKECQSCVSPSRPIKASHPYSISGGWFTFMLKHSRWSTGNLKCDSSLLLKFYRELCVKKQQRTYDELMSAVERQHQRNPTLTIQGSDIRIPKHNKGMPPFFRLKTDSSTYRRGLRDAIANAPGLVCSSAEVHSAAKLSIHFSWEKKKKKVNPHKTQKPV